MGFGAKKQSTSTTYEMSPEQRALIEPVIPAAKAYLANPPKLPDYSQIAPFNPTQLAAQNSLIGSVLPQMETAGAAADANKFLLGDVLYPGSNPALQATIDASVRPIYEGLTESALPAIRGEFNTAGQFGGSRQGIAEGLATREASRAAGDTAAKVATQGYQSGLEAMTKGLALAPETSKALTIPGQTLGAVGDVNYGMEQSRLSEQAYKDMYAQIAPFLAAQEVAQVGSSIPGGTTTSTGPAPSTNPLSAGLGLTSILASLFGGGGATLSAPALAAVFGGGAGLF